MNDSIDEMEFVPINRLTEEEADERRKSILDLIISPFHFNI